MIQIYPDNGLPFSLVQYVAGGMRYHLFVSDSQPSLADTISSYVEAAWSGYAPITVPDGVFVPSVVFDHIAQITAPAIHFPNTSGIAQQVYGFFVTDMSDTFLRAVGRFDHAPITIAHGSSMPVIPAFGTYSGLQNG